MSVLELAAQKVSNSMVTDRVDKKVAFDPAVIAVIVEIITDLIKLYQGCNQTPQQAVLGWKSPGLVDRWLLRRAIKNNVDDDEVYDAIGTQLYNAIKVLGHGANEEDAKALFAAV